METIYSSTFLPKHHQLSFKIDQNSQYLTKNRKNTIVANSSFTKIITTLKKKNKENQYSINLASIFNKVDDFICKFMDLPLRPSLDPKLVLSGNIAPVDELPPTACAVVEGSLPACLDGAYIRNGPNPQFNPNGRPYNFLDGDGMLHVIRISQGKATYCCRYVNTHKHTVESEVGYPFVPSIFSSFNGVAASAARAALVVARVLAKQFDPLNHGIGTANTSVALISGRLFALCESDLPYAVKLTPEGDVITLGRHDFETTEPFFSMSAHPKIDRVTGEAFAIGYNITAPFLTFFRIDSGGKKQNVPISSLKGFAFIHDFALTENYAVFSDLQIAVNPMWIVKGRSLVGVDAAKVPRLGVIPKFAKDDREMWWVEVPGFNMMHCANAWEEDGGAIVTLVASNVAAVEHMFERVNLAELTMEKIAINVKDRTVVRQSLSNQTLDMGVINPAYATKKNKYVYAAVIGTRTAVGVVKLDLSLSVSNEDCTVASRLYGPGCYSGEPFFVAREPNNPSAEEDDGYLVTYMYDENIQESKFLVMDAKSPSLDIVAAVKLPQRVPDGFHGLFVSEFDLHNI